MRVTALIVVVVMASVFGSSRLAHAEKVKTNQSAKVYSHPGEQSPVVIKVKSGQNMTVIGKEGRWLKVRVQGRTGYVPRSKVDGADDDELVRNTRRRPFVDGRGTKRGFGGEAGPEDRIGADATGAGADSKTEDDDDKPAPKKHAKADDDDDDSKADKTPPKKHAKAVDDDDDSDKPPPKKAKVEDKPKKAKPAAADTKPKKAKASDDDDDEDTDKPAPKKAKADDDDDDAKVSDDKDSDDPKQDDRPMAHVSDKTKIFNEADKDSGTSFVAKPTDVLYPTDKKGSWTFVETEEGDGGWVQSSQLDVADSAESGGGGERRPVIDVRARLGFTLISQSMHSTGSTFMGGVFNPDDYTIGTSAYAVALGGGVLYPYKANYVVGGELEYTYAASGNINYGTMTNSGISMHDVRVHLLGGYDLHKKNGTVLFARLGYRYQGYLVGDYNDTSKNGAMLPSEVFQAPTVGIGVAIPRLTQKVGLKLALDAIVAGASVSQTKGYEDGSTPSARAVLLGGAVTYHWKNNMDIQATYDLNYTTIDFGAPAPDSIRGHTGTDTARTDLFHTLTLGIARAF